MGDPTWLEPPSACSARPVRHLPMALDVGPGTFPGRVPGRSGRGSLGRGDIAITSDACDVIRPKRPAGRTSLALGVESQWRPARPRWRRAFAERSASLTWPLASQLSHRFACVVVLANGSSAASLAWRCSHEPSDDGRRFRPTVLPNLVLGQGTKSVAYAPLRKTDWFEAPSSHVPITPRGPSRLAPTNLPVCALRPDHRVEARNEFR